VAGFCEHGDEPSGSVRNGIFFDDLRNSQLSNNILHHGVSE
jgi:hypothetical protein